LTDVKKYIINKPYDSNNKSKYVIFS